MSADSPLVLFVGGVPFTATENDISEWFATQSNGAIKKEAITKVELPTHADSGRKKGYAVVTFAEEASVNTAKTLDKADMNGRYLNIRPYSSEPPQRAERPPREKKPRAPKAHANSAPAPADAAAASASGDANAAPTKRKRTRKPKNKPAAGASAEAAAASSAPREPKVRAPRPPRAAFVAPPGHKTVFVGNLPWSTTEEELAGLLSKDGGCTVRLGWDAARNRAKGFAHIDFETAEQAQAAVAMNGTEMGGRPLKIAYAPERKEQPAAGEQAQA